MTGAFKTHNGVIFKPCIFELKLLKNIIVLVRWISHCVKSMRMKFVIQVLFIIFTAFDSNAQISYKGSIDKLPVELVGDFYPDGVVNAFYVYSKFDQSIRLSGSLKSEHLILTEKNDSGKGTATLTFENFNSKSDTLKGVWKEISSGRELRIVLIKTYTLNEDQGPAEVLQMVSLKDKYFRLVIRSEPGTAYPRVKAVKIFEKKTDKLLQQIPVDCETWGINGMSVDDYNFDGFPDFSVFEQSYAGPNTSSLYFLYNPKTGMFFKSTFEGTSLTFDKKTKRIFEHNQCCAGKSHMNAVYKVVNNKMVLVSRTCQEYNESKGELMEVKCE